MTPEELRERLDGGVSLPELQNIRDPIREHTGLVVPRRPSDAEDWYSRKKGVLTRKLNTQEDKESVEDSETDEEESDEEDEEETENGDTE